MMLSTIHKNSILTSYVDSFCLVCDCYLKTDNDIHNHIATSAHKKTLELCGFIDNFKDDYIRKVKKGYYCQFCNVILSTSAKVRLHVVEKQHVVNKGMQQLKRVGKTVVAYNNIIIDENAWNGIMEDICAVCNIEFSDLNTHLSDNTHLLNLVRSKIEFGVDKAVYRMVDDSSIHCLTCNMILASSAMTAHFESIQHKEDIAKHIEADSEIEHTINQEASIDLENEYIPAKVNNISLPAFSFEPTKIGKDDVIHFVATKNNIDDSTVNGDKLIPAADIKTPVLKEGQTGVEKNISNLQDDKFINRKKLNYVPSHLPEKFLSSKDDNRASIIVLEKLVPNINNNVLAMVPTIDNIMNDPPTKISNDLPIKLAIDFAPNSSYKDPSVEVGKFLKTQELNEIPTKLVNNVPIKQENGFAPNICMESSLDVVTVPQIQDINSTPTKLENDIPTKLVNDFAQNIGDEDPTMEFGNFLQNKPDDDVPTKLSHDYPQNIGNEDLSKEVDTVLETEFDYIPTETGNNVLNNLADHVEPTNDKEVDALLQAEMINNVETEIDDAVPTKILTEIDNNQVITVNNSSQTDMFDDNYDDVPTKIPVDPMDNKKTTKICNNLHTDEENNPITPKQLSTKSDNTVATVEAEKSLELEIDSNISTGDDEEKELLAIKVHNEGPAIQTEKSKPVEDNIDLPDLKEFDREKRKTNTGNAGEVCSAINKNTFTENTNKLQTSMCKHDDSSAANALDQDLSEDINILDAGTSDDIDLGAVGAETNVNHSLDSQAIEPEDVAKDASIPYVSASECIASSARSRASAHETVDSNDSDDETTGQVASSSNTVFAIEKKTKKSKSRRHLTLDEKCCKTMQAKDYITNDIHSDKKFCILCDLVVDPCYTAQHIKGHHHMTILEMHKEWVQARDANTKRSRKKLSEIPDDDNNNRDNRDDYQKLLDGIDNFYAHGVTINFKNTTAQCTKCNKPLHFEYQAIDKHIKEHVEPTADIEAALLQKKRSEEFQNQFKNAKAHIPLFSIKEVNNKITREYQKAYQAKKEALAKLTANKVEKPKPIEDQVKVEKKKSYRRAARLLLPCRDSEGEVKPIEVEEVKSDKPCLVTSSKREVDHTDEIFAKENNLTFIRKEGKANCNICNIRVPSSIDSMKEHIEGAFHKNKIIMKVNSEEFINIMTITDFMSELNVIINDSFCLNLYSFFLFYAKDRSKADCFLCDVEFSVTQLDSHKMSAIHEEEMFKIAVVTSLEGEFVREIREGVFHCGFCNVLQKSWEDLQKHLELMAHKDSRANSYWRLEQQLSSISEECVANQTDRAIFMEFVRELSFSKKSG